MQRTDQQAAALRQEILAGLERTIWTPPPGVSEFDRVDAVRLLGQFRDPAAGTALLRVLNEATRGIGPPLGRLLRDTALDTLLRSSAQPPATVERNWLPTIISGPGCGVGGWTATSSTTTSRCWCSTGAAGCCCAATCCR